MKINADAQSLLFTICFRAQFISSRRSQGLKLHMKWPSLFIFFMGWGGSSATAFTIDTTSLTSNLNLVRGGLLLISILRLI
jgi:hypothetical protein